MSSRTRKILSLVLAFTFIFQQAGFAQALGQLDISSYMGQLSTFAGVEKFRPLHLRYFSYDPITDNFQILLDKGTVKNITDAQIKEQGQELLRYFLVGIALPDEKFWVNLRPDSENKIIDETLLRTDLGKVLLEADLQLKKDVARFTSPQTSEGRAYWNALYKKANEIFGTENVTIPTLTRPWIVPGEVIIRETANSAYVYKGTLQVMLEQDHLKNSTDYNFSDPRLKELNEYSSQLIREKIIPKLTKEVNSSKVYAPLRQVFYSLILARWFKARFSGKSGMYANLINTGNLTGLNSQQNWSKTTYFKEYQKSFSKGEYNIQEQVNSITGPTIRTYFSGGIGIRGNELKMPTPREVSSPIATFRGANGNIIPALTGTTMIPLGGFASVRPNLERQYLPRSTDSKKITTASSPLEIRTDFTVPEGQKLEFFTSDYHSYRISELFTNSIEQIPDEVVDAVRGKLKQAMAEGKILSAEVNDYGASDIDIQVTHRFGELNAAVQRVIMEAMKEGCLKAQELGLLKKDIRVASMSLEELARAMRMKYEPFSITERGSEAFVRIKLINAGIGAANIKLFEQFFITGATPLKQLGFLPEVNTKKKDKLPVRGFRAVVRRTSDVLKGKLDGDVWEFEKSSAAEIDGVKYTSVDESDQLEAMVGQTNDFVITEIYPVEGSLVSSKEPLVKVVFQPVYGEKGNLRALNPTFLCRSQSGADAVAGVATAFYHVNFVPGGPKGENQVATMPVTKEQARKAPPEGIAYVVVDGWQFKGYGFIPPEKGGVIDHVKMNPSAFSWERKTAKRFAGIMTTHKKDQPYIAPFAAEAQVEPTRKAQAHLFKRAPKEADPDPLMDEVEAKVASGEFVAFNDDKADMGGKFGHNYTPEYMLALDRATEIEAIEKEEVTDGNIIGFVSKGRLKNGTTNSIGDDGHIISLGDKSRNAANSHQSSFTALTRGYLASMVGNRVDFNPAAPLGKPESLKTAEKPYGRAQDYAGKEAKAAMANPYFYSRLNERFFEILRKVMPLDYMQMVENMYAGWKYWQEHGTSGELPKPFSGNVSSQGMGTARYLVNIAAGERRVGVLAGDKCGPAGINRPIREGVYAALSAGEFSNGLVFEIWDAKAFDEHGNIPLNEIPESYADIADAVGELKDEAGQNDEAGQTFIKNSYRDGLLRDDLTTADKERLAQLIKKSGFVPTKRILLEAERNKVAIELYLADSDRFNIKQVWAKKESGWDINNPQGYLDRPILGSSVTKLGILAGGEYIGKDDPVMVGNIILMEHIYKFIEKNPVILQGDMNGSHWLAAIPTAFKYAVANKESHPILVGFRYTLSEDGKTVASVEDVFGARDYVPIRSNMFRFDIEFKYAQLGGQMEPYATNWRTIEAAYPKNKLLKQLQRPNSPFLIRNKPAEQRQTRPISTVTEAAELFKVATSMSDVASSPVEIVLHAQPSSKLSGMKFSVSKIEWLEPIPSNSASYGQDIRELSVRALAFIDEIGNPYVTKEEDGTFSVKEFICGSHFGSNLYLDLTNIRPGVTATGELYTDRDKRKVVARVEIATEATGASSLTSLTLPEIFAKAQRESGRSEFKTLVRIAKIYGASIAPEIRSWFASMSTAVDDEIRRLANEATDALRDPKNKSVMRLSSWLTDLELFEEVKKQRDVNALYDLLTRITRDPGSFLRSPEISSWLAAKTTAVDDEIRRLANEAMDALKVGSSPVNTKDATDRLGGIDFRKIPMITQPMGNFSGLSLNLPKLSNVDGINLDQELAQLQDMLRAGIAPSGERIKEYVAACYQKGQLKTHLDGIVSCLVELCKLEEEKVAETANELKEVMLILDSMG